MSTQAARSIRFTHTFPQQGFRLLELPPELLELLSSDDPPTLLLKSPPPEAYQSTADSSGAREYVNLCTPTKTFRLRQVQSSNSIHLIRPSNGSIPSDNGDAELDLTETVTAIAKCGSTLELHTLEEGFSATQFLERSLKLYDWLSVDGDVQMGEGGGLGSALTLSERKRVKEEILRDVPMSVSECESAWKELCAFVHSDTTTGDNSGLTGFRPSARVKLDVWKRMVEGSVLQGIDMEKQFLVKDLWKAVLDEDGEEPFPQPLFEAVVRRLAESSGSNDAQAYDSELKWSNLDKVVSIRWVGETYLEVSAPTAASAIGRTEFINGWKDLLPESWRDQATLDALTVRDIPFPSRFVFSLVDCLMSRRALTSIRTRLQYASCMSLNARR
ncbi:hypothetical protein T310_0304 [Rasamsonia emersonii CBS 393.64]|uniref:Sister chromatid cohesion protein Dcc1 n=1 Tax=Rasamsonia emersonii (strain ATCC 16479 / CBS 393.64 / IMI 116815) TaxID=1408163 RepID=A0A0F4Z565_RASE3|nr:hypothetical protein T310_0304 [Rasamsonia emersonii CBS 393.64]KKA25664.1 hypothetical protein T310_0304 [Rasamsonia emersonii CBS 393.64]